MHEMMKKSNKEFVSALREQMLKPNSVEPSAFGLNLVESVLKSNGLDKGLSVTILCAIVHHSLKHVSKETFVKEMEQAMDDYFEYMFKKVG
jgi:hypothetical protein